MRPGRGSFSAQAVALARAIESQRRDALFHDPLARALLHPALRPVADACGLPLLGPLLLRGADLVMGGARDGVVGRTCYIDDALRAWLGREHEQLVLLGAGLDSRALRLPQAARGRVFEVDHPATQAAKRAALARGGAATPHVVFVALDFNRDALAEALLAAGFDPAQRTFFIWEGVTEYLTAAAVDATLRQVARLGAAGSRLLFTYQDVAGFEDRARFAGAHGTMALFRWAGEPYTFGLEPRVLGGYLAARGLRLLEDVGGHDFARRYFAPRGRACRVTDFERAALAEVAPPADSRAPRPPLHVA